MNEKGETGIGTFLGIFIGVIVALVLFQATAVFTGQTINTYALTNRTFTAPAVNSTIDLVGQELLTPAIVANSSNASAPVISGTNFTVAEGVSTVDGLKRIRLTTNDAGAANAGKPVNVSYNYGGEGYIDDAAGRSITGIILLLAALAIGVFVISRIYDNGLDIFG